MKMNKGRKKTTKTKTRNVRLYDVAVGPTLLMIYGIPAVIILAVIGLVILTVWLIRKSVKRNEEKAPKEADHNKE